MADWVYVPGFVLPTTGALAVVWNFGTSVQVDRPPDPQTLQETVDRLLPLGPSDQATELLDLLMTWPLLAAGARRELWMLDWRRRWAADEQAFVVAHRQDMQHRHVFSMARRRANAPLIAKARAKFMGKAKAKVKAKAKARAKGKAKAKAKAAAVRPAGRPARPALLPLLPAPPTDAGSSPCPSPSYAGSPTEVPSASGSGDEA